MIRETTVKLSCRKKITFEEAKGSFEDIFEDRALPSQIASFLTALSLKGEGYEEILAAAEVIRKKCRRVEVKDNFMGIVSEEAIFDTCGTGGSGLNKFNISTAVAFIVSACGIKVAKHGNRSMSSVCGSADVLEALGININAKPSVMEDSIRKTGIGFLYAPLYHPALANVARIRKEIGIKTIFNILGPLCNPAFATHQLMGVHSRHLCDTLAKVLKKLGVRKAMVIFGKDLKDEISLTGSTYACYLDNKAVKRLNLTPSVFGLKKVSLSGLLVKNARESADIIERIFRGDKIPARNVVLANASACFHILSRVKDFKEGAALAGKIIDEGKARAKLQEFRDFLNKYA